METHLSHLRLAALQEGKKVFQILQRVDEVPGSSSKRGQPPRYQGRQVVACRNVLKSCYWCICVTACLGMKQMDEGLLITAGVMAAAAEAATDSNSGITLPPWYGGGGATTAFDNVNLLSAPRVEHERPFYCIEEGEQESPRRQQFATPRHVRPCDDTG